VHGCGWDSGAAREQRSSALAASVASRYALGGERVPEGFLVATEGRREAGALGAFATLARMVKAARRVSTFWEPGPVRWARLRPSR